MRRFGLRRARLGSPFQVHLGRSRLVRGVAVVVSEAVLPAGPAPFSSQVGLLWREYSQSILLQVCALSGISMSEAVLPVRFGTGKVWALTSAYGLTCMAVVAPTPEGGGSMPLVVGSGEGLTNG